MDFFKLHIEKVNLLFLGFKPYKIENELYSKGLANLKAIYSVSRDVATKEKQKIIFQFY